MEYDLFICHASADKDNIVRPFWKYLQAFGINTFFDEASIEYGESINQKVMHGLAKSQGSILMLTSTFYTRDFTKYEMGGIFYKKYNQGGYIYIIYWDDKDLAEVSKRFPFVRDLKCFHVIEGTKLIEVAREISQDFKKRIKKVNCQKQGSGRFGKLLIISSIIIALFSILYLLFSRESTTYIYHNTQIPEKKKDNSSGELKNNQYPPSLNSRPKEFSTSGLSTNVKPLNNSPVEENKFIEPSNQEDFSKYINTKCINSSDNIDVSIMVIDEETKKIDHSLSSNIADIYNKKGYKTTTGLIKNTFIEREEFLELFGGSSELIEKLKLINFSDYVIIGLASYKYTPGKLVSGTIVCSISLNFNILSTSSQSIFRSSTFHDINGLGVSKVQAKETATQKFLNVFCNELSPL